MFSSEQDKMENSRAQDKDHRRIASNKATSVNSTATLVVVFFSLLVDLLGFTVILPLIPSLLDYYSTKDEVSVYIGMVGVYIICSFNVIQQPLLEAASAPLVSHLIAVSTPVTDFMQAITM